MKKFYRTQISVFSEEEMQAKEMGTKVERPHDTWRTFVFDLSQVQCYSDSITDAGTRCTRIMFNLDSGVLINTTFEEFDEAFQRFCIAAEGYHHTSRS